MGVDSAVEAKILALAAESPSSHKTFTLSLSGNPLILAVFFFYQIIDFLPKNRYILCIFTG